MFITRKRFEEVVDRAVNKALAEERDRANLMERLENMDKARWSLERRMEDLEFCYGHKSYSTPERGANEI